MHGDSLVYAAKTISPITTVTDYQRGYIRRQQDCQERLVVLAWIGIASVWTSYKSPVGKKKQHHGSYICPSGFIILKTKKLYHSY